MSHYKKLGCDTQTFWLPQVLKDKLRATAAYLGVPATEIVERAIANEIVRIEQIKGGQSKLLL